MTDQNQGSIDYVFSNNPINNFIKVRSIKNTKKTPYLS